jgi:hypothetical protein
MATARIVMDLKVKPGRQNELLEGLKGLKKVAERLGGQLRANRVRFGDPVHLFAVAEWPDIPAWTKAQTDAELVALADAMRNNPNPPWESLSLMLLEDIPL